MDLFHCELDESKRKHSDFVIFQNLPKEAREAMKASGEKSPIIGNSSYLQPQEATPNSVNSNNYDDFIPSDEGYDLPF